MTAITPAQPVLVHLEIARVGSTSPATYLLKTPINSFYVGESVYWTINGLRKNMTYAQIASQLKGFGLNVSEQGVQNLAENTLTRLNEQATGPDRPNAHMGYVFGRTTLLRPQYMARLMRVLGYLFSPALMISLSTLCLLATGFYFFQFSEGFFTEHRSIWQDNQGIWLVVACAIYFIIFIAHELGHASATHRFGLIPGDIGFGFYLIFPVFYADVSVAWALDRTRRIIVNLGGVYFQLILNGLFIVIFYTSSATGLFISPLIVLNSGVMLYSLNPFLRYDGYWIYSDLFNIPNLRKQSKQYRAILLNRLKKSIRGELPRSQWVRTTEWPLCIYAVSSKVVLSVLILMFVKVLIESLVQTGTILSYYGHPYVNQYLPDDLIVIGRTLFLLAMSGIVIHRQVKARRLSTTRIDQTTQPATNLYGNA